MDRDQFVREFLRQNNNVSELSAERLNLFLERSEQLDAVAEDADDTVANPDTSRADSTNKPAAAPPLWKQRLRIALPHLGLVTISTIYTILGAVMFWSIEKPYEIMLRNESVHRIKELKVDVTTRLWLLSRESNVSAWEWADEADAQLDRVIFGVHHDFTRNYMKPADLTNASVALKWTFPASVFFSWTAITTIGYGHIVPRTVKGRVCLLIYCLLGIPLILVTIADMGRFLSGGVIWLNAKLRHCFSWCQGCCVRCCAWICCRGRYRLMRERLELLHQVRRARAAAANASPERSGTFEDISEIQTHSQRSGPGAAARRGEQRLDAEGEQGSEGGQQERSRVSVLFILVLMIGYTAGGAMLLRLWETWSFFDSFYYCFVTVTTIGFGDIVPQSEPFLWATLLYIVFGLIITTMCIDLVGSEYIRDIHFYGRFMGRSFMTFGGKVVHLGEVFGYVAFLQRQYGITPEQLDRLAGLPDNYLLECLVQGRQPDLRLLLHAKPFIPNDIFYFKWIEQPRTLSVASEKLLASIESLDFVSRASTARTLTPREYYHHMLMQYCRDDDDTRV